VPSENLVKRQRLTDVGLKGMRTAVSGYRCLRARRKVRRVASAHVAPGRRAL